MRDRWIKYDSLTSTNSVLAELLRQQTLEEGTVVIADYQESGRGQGDHSWHSRRGENLLMSLLLFPAFLSASMQFHLSRVASLALCDALDTLGITSRIKWPNDILTRKGKIAGILIEHSITGSHISRTVIGLGLNLNQTAFPDFELPATSVHRETGRPVDVTELGELVESCLMSRYQALREGRMKQLEMDYLSRLFKAGERSGFDTPEGHFDGIIRGVNDSGELMVESDGEVRTYGHGSINMELNFRKP